MPYLCAVHRSRNECHVLQIKKRRKKQQTHQVTVCTCARSYNLTASSKWPLVSVSSATTSTMLCVSRRNLSMAPGRRVPSICSVPSNMSNWTNKQPAAFTQSQFVQFLRRQFKGLVKTNTKAILTTKWKQENVTVCTFTLVTCKYRLLVMLFVLS